MIWRAFKIRLKANNTNPKVSNFTFLFMTVKYYMTKISVILKRMTFLLLRDLWISFEAAKYR